MNVNNITVEELGRKYRDKNYRLLYQIQVDYKKPPISKMIYLDKEALTALSSKVREFVDDDKTDITKQNIVMFGHKCSKDCEADIGSIVDIREANSFAEIAIIDKKQKLSLAEDIEAFNKSKGFSFDDIEGNTKSKIKVKRQAKNPKVANQGITEKKKKSSANKSKKKIKKK